MDDVEVLPPENNSLPQKALTFLAFTIAGCALIRAGNYRAALLFYRRTGGGGLNIYKQQENGKSQRAFAIDYHPFWDNTTKQNTWKLHYHRGENSNQMKKHRPYEGGW